MTDITKARLFIKRFLGEDVSSLPVDKLKEKLEEANFVRELEINIIAKAISDCFSEKD